MAPGAVNLAWTAVSAQALARVAAERPAAAQAKALASEMGVRQPVTPTDGGAAAGGGEDAGAAEEKDAFDVMLPEVPADKKIAILKIVRNITGLGLKEAKGMVESAPVAIKEGASKDEAADIQKQIEEIEGKVELK